MSPIWLPDFLHLTGDWPTHSGTITGDRTVNEAEIHDDLPAPSSLAPQALQVDFERVLA